MYLKLYLLNILIYVDAALERNMEILAKNQNATDWFCSIINETMNKIVTKQKNPPQMNISKQFKTSTKISLKQCFLFNTDKASLNFLRAD